jgi:hypothetical protein
MADGEHRIEGHHRILEDHRGRAAAQPRERALIGVEHIDIIEDHAVSGNRGGCGEEPQERHAGHRFARAGLADNTQAVALIHVQADATHGLDSPAMLGEADLQVLDVD